MEFIVEKKVIFKFREKQNIWFLVSVENKRALKSSAVGIHGPLLWWSAITSASNLLGFCLS
jgi:hypothetical protein